MRPAAFRCAKPCAGCSRHPEQPAQRPCTRDSGLGTRDSGLGTRDSGLGTRDSGLGTRDERVAIFLMSSRTAYALFGVIPDGAQRRAGIQWPCGESDWIPASAGMTAKRQRHPGRWPLSFDVIPDGAPHLMRSSQTARRAEPVRHPGRRAAPSRDPDKRHANACAARLNALRARPLQPSHWIPGSACGGPGMTPESKTPRLTARPLF